MKQIEAQAFWESSVNLRLNELKAEVEGLKGNPIASKNTLLGFIDLEGIAPMPAGKPKILVSYLIDREGILHVSASDENGNEQKATLKNAGKLEKREVKRMIKEAAMPAEERKLLQEKRQELSNAIKKFQDQPTDQKMLVKVEEAQKLLQEELSAKELTKAITELQD